VQGLYVGIICQATRQEFYCPLDHREGIGIDDPATAIKDEFTAAQMTFQNTELLGHQLVSGLDGGFQRFLAFVRRVTIRQEA